MVGCADKPPQLPSQFASIASCLIRFGYRLFKLQSREKLEPTSAQRCHSATLRPCLGEHAPYPPKNDEKSSGMISQQTAPTELSDTLRIPPPQLHPARPHPLSFQARSISRRDTRTRQRMQALVSTPASSYACAPNHFNRRVPSFSHTSNGPPLSLIAVCWRWRKHCRATERSNSFLWWSPRRYRVTP